MAKNNTIRELLDHVTLTGRVPDPKTIRAAITKYSSVAERREIEGQVRKAAKRIVNALDSNLPTQAAEHAAEVAETYAAHTAAGASAEDLPDRWTTKQYDDTRTPPGRGYGERRISELLAGAPQGKVRAQDIDALVADLGPDVDADAFRSDLADLIDDTQHVHRTGAHADAREMLRDAAGQLGGLLVEPEHEDPHADVEDPRALAGLVRRDR